MLPYSVNVTSVVWLCMVWSGGINKDDDYEVARLGLGFIVGTLTVYAVNERCLGREMECLILVRL